LIPEQFIVLQVVVPLVAAPLCLLLRRPRLSWLLAVGVGWSTFAIAVALLMQVADGSVLTYPLGGWAAPWGIEYRVDALSALLLVLVSGIGALVLSFAPRSMAAEIEREQHYLFLTAFLLCLTGLLGIAITGDLFNVFVFLEISALSSYVLISMGRDRRALTAAFQYLIMGTIGATFILIAVGLMYMMTGTLNMADMAQRIGALDPTRTMLAAFAFLSIGVGLKMAIFPLHAWMPNAYTYAPSIVSAFLAATATKISVYILLRFVFSVFGAEYFTQVGSDRILLVLALIGIVVTSIVAVFQRNVKRMLAYSSVAQIGYMALGISFASVNGLTGSIVHLVNHGLMKGGMFLALGCMVYRTGSAQLDDLSGLGRRMPWTMAAWVVGGLGLIGVPLTVGFISKWFLVLAALERGMWPVAALLLLGSLLALVYVWRVVEVAYFRAPRGDKVITEAPASLLVPTWILIGATLVFGVWTSWTVDVARRAAELLLGGGS